MEAHTIHRIAAYLVDVFILSILLSLLTFWIPVSDKYNESVEKQETLLSDYKSEKIDESQLYKELFSISYTMEKETKVISIISIILTLGYFGTFAYYNNGQTLGKKLLKIKVASSNEKKLKHWQFIGRTLVANSVIESIISVILIFFIKENSYMYTIGILGIIQDIILIASFLMICIRKDKKSIHDFLFNTRVIQE